MSLLEDLTSRDPQRIWSSACAIRKLRDNRELSVLAEHLDQIKQSTHDVPLGGSLRPNSSHLNFAIRKIEYVQNEEGCLCGLYPLDDLYNPDEEAKAGNVTILGTTVNAEEWSGTYKCQCRLCHARYHVEQGEYHYTWWAWKRV